MSAILSDNFRFYNLENFIDTFNSNSIYLFIGRPYQWDSENNPPSPLDNSYYTRDVYEQIISFKKLSTSDIIPVINNNVWQSGRIYDMYRPDYTTGNSENVVNGSSASGLRYPSKFSSNGSSALNYGSTFYVVNEFYQVYKCLYNGETPTNPNGVPSTVEPTGISTSPIVTSDGYRWKYLYTIPTYYVLNFKNDYYIPVPYPGSSFPPETAITSSAVPGSIDTVVIKNSGSGYLNGIYTNIPILGDGTNGTITIIVSNGQIASAFVTNPGSGYSFAKIDISSAGIGSGSGGNLEIIVPPKYGHGYQPYLELGAYKLMIHTSLSYSEPTIPTDISYRRIGLVANPYIKGSTTIATSANINQLYSVSFTSVNGSFQVGEIITQSNTNATARVVSWDSTNKVLKYYQDAWDGTYNNNLIPFSGNNIVTGTTSNAVGSGTSNYISPGIEKNTGKILYIDNRVSVTRSPSQIEDIKIVVEF